MTSNDYFLDRKQRKIVPKNIETVNKKISVIGI